MPETLSAIADLLWPLVLAGLIIALFPVVRRMLSESDSVNIEVGGTKVSIQRASDDLKHLIDDLQDRVNELEHATNPHPGATGKSELHTNQPAQLLWVDDRPEANVYERARVTEAGGRVVQASSTEEALRLIYEAGPFDVVVSDMGRVENNGRMNPRAGLDLLESLRSSGDKTPVVFYTSSRGLAQASTELDKHSDVQATASPSELMRILAVSDVAGPKR